MSEPIVLGKVVLCLQKLAPEWPRPAAIVLLSGNQMAALSGQLLLKNVFKVLTSGVTRLIIQQPWTLGYKWCEQFLFLSLIVVEVLKLHKLGELALPSSLILQHLQQTFIRFPLLSSW